MKIRINIVDDHKIITDGLQMILSDDDTIEIQNVAHSGEVALSHLVNGKPDILLLDYSLSDSERSSVMNGYQTAERVLSEYPEVKIMMLTMHNSSEIIVPCITLGVHGYMLKSEKNVDIASAIHHLHNFGFYFSPDVAKDLAVNIRNHSQDRIEISTRELEVLEALFKGGSTREIADELCLSTHTVETHRKNLIHKFEAKNSIHLIYLALTKGIISI